MKRKFEGYCSHCKRLITGSATIGIGRCCLIKNYTDFGCPNHGSGELVVKSKWIGVKNCQGCRQEIGEPDESGINQIVWELV